jgi:hypothetical protein
MYGPSHLSAQVADVKALSIAHAAGVKLIEIAATEAVGWVRES